MNILLAMLAGAFYSASYVAPRDLAVWCLILSGVLVVIVRFNG